VTEPTTPESSQRAVDESEAAAGADEASAADADAEVAQPAAGKARRTVGVVLASVLGVVALLCVGGLGTGYFLYYKASEPDRSTPGLAVRQYLHATFETRDKAKADQFTCQGQAALGEIDQTLADIVSREQRFNIRITVGWENFVAEQAKETATVDTRLKIAVPEQTGQSSESFQLWRFDVRHQSSGWRVCGAKRAG
jgi:hypothetical protein